MQRLLNAYETIGKLQASEKSTFDVKAIEDACFAAMNDDFNTAIVVAVLFDAARLINSVHAGTEKISADGIVQMKKVFDDFLFTILGIKIETKDTSQDIEGLMQLILDIRSKAKSNKDFQTSDQIRDTLSQLGIAIKDTKDGATWSKL